ncbi:hypothetical protein WAI453_013126 [Rhynchosporium graminicola]
MNSETLSRVAAIVIENPSIALISISELSKIQIDQRLLRRYAASLSVSSEGTSSSAKNLRRYQSLRTSSPQFILRGVNDLRPNERLGSTPRSYHRHLAQAQAQAHTVVRSEEVLMAFEVMELDSTIDFETVPANVAQMITGWGQMVYWKGCNVTVYEKDNDGKEQTRKLIGMPNGQGQVPSGTELYVTDGKVKEK